MQRTTLAVPCVHFVTSLLVESLFSFDFHLMNGKAIHNLNVLSCHCVHMLQTRKMDFKAVFVNMDTISNEM